MADYRQIHTKIWKDGWFIDLSDQEKLLFIYLFSNERASIAGMYELPVKIMSFETGMDRKVVEAALAKFSKAGKVHYENGLVWVVNLRKYNENSSPKVAARLCKDLATISDCQLKRRYLAFYNPIESDGYGIDRVSIPKPEQPSEQEHEQEHEHEQENEQEQELGAEAPALPDPKEKLLIVQPVLQEQLARYYQSQGRSVPRHYQSDQQRQAFEAVCDTLGGELRPLTEKAFSRQMSSLPKLLAWLEGCAKHINGNAQPKPKPAPTKQEQADLAATIAAIKAHKEAQRANP